MRNNARLVLLLLFTVSVFVTIGGVFAQVEYVNVTSVTADYYVIPGSQNEVTGTVDYSFNEPALLLVQLWKGDDNSRLASTGFEISGTGTEDFELRYTAPETPGIYPMQAFARYERNGNNMDFGSYSGFVFYISVGSGPSSSGSTETTDVPEPEEPTETPPDETEDDSPETSEEIIATDQTDGGIPSFSPIGVLAGLILFVCLMTIQRKN